MHSRVSFRGGNIIRHESRKRDGSFGEVGYSFMLFLDVIWLQIFTTREGEREREKLSEKEKRRKKE